MPIEVRELVIKATVTQGGGSQQKQSVQSDIAKDDIISECVDQVMQILKEKMDR